MFKMINLGDKVRDQITGLRGIVTGIAEYITGCRQALVQPPMKGEDFVEPRWVDEPRLTIIEAGALSFPDSARETGADIPAPIR